MRELSPDDLRGRIAGLIGRDVPAEAVEISQEKMQTLTDFWDLSKFLVERQDFDPKAWEKVMGQNGAAECLREAREALESVEPFDAEGVERALRGVVERLGVKPKEVFQPVRVAISGTTVSPGIFESVAVLGREETIARIDAALRRAAEG
jgi:glutamyl-tRNA synthetase